MKEEELTMDEEKISMDQELTMNAVTESIADEQFFDENILQIKQEFPEDPLDTDQLEQEEYTGEILHRRKNGTLGEAEEKSLAWFNFLTNFRERVVDPEDASEAYREIFKPGAEPRTMATGLKEVRENMFELIYESYRHLPSSEISESRMEIFLFLLEKEKPGILKLATRKGDFGVDSPLYGANITNITQMDHIRKNWKQSYHTFIRDKNLRMSEPTAKDSLRVNIIKRSAIIDENSAVQIPQKKKKIYLPPRQELAHEKPVPLTDIQMNSQEKEVAPAVTTTGCKEVFIADSEPRTMKTGLREVQTNIPEDRSLEQCPPKRKRVVFDEAEEKSLAWFNFITNFHDKVVNPEGTTAGYKEIFNADSEPRTMKTGIKEVQKNLFELIYESYKNLPSSEITESRMEIFLFLLEMEKPGILKFASGKGDFDVDSPLYGTKITNITRIDRIRKTWKQSYHEHFLRNRVTPTSEELKEPQKKMNPGKRSVRRGRNSLNLNTLSYWDSCSQEPITDFADRRTDLNKLLKMSPTIWKMHAPQFFTSLEPMKEQVIWLFQDCTADGKLVKNLDMEKIVQDLPRKLDIFTEAVEKWLERMRYQNLDGLLAEELANSSTNLPLAQCDEKEAKHVLAIRKFGGLVGGERSTIVMENELRGQQALIVMKTAGSDVVYDVIAENCVLYTLPCLIDALVAYFLILFAGGVQYEKSGQLFGFVLEMFFFDREQTMKPKQKDKDVYDKIRNIINKSGDIFPALESTVSFKNS